MDEDKIKFRNRVAFFVTILLVILICITYCISTAIQIDLEKMGEWRNTFNQAERYVISERSHYIYGDEWEWSQEYLTDMQETSEQEETIERAQKYYDQSHERMSVREYLLSPCKEISPQYIKLVYAGSDKLFSKDYEVPLTRYYFNIYDRQGEEGKVLLSTRIDEVDGDRSLFLYQEDVNEDGYLDLRLIRSISNRTGDVIYLWNPTEKNYEEMVGNYQG